VREHGNRFMVYKRNARIAIVPDVARRARSERNLSHNKGEARVTLRRRDERSAEHMAPQLVHGRTMVRLFASSLNCSSAQRLIFCLIQTTAFAVIDISRARVYI